MDTKILPFPLPQSVRSPIGHFIRIGEAHKKLADLHASGRLPATRVVVEASRFRHQKELISELQGDGAEIVLDTEVAELAALGKISSHSRQAPWAAIAQGGLLGPEFFSVDSAHDVIGRIARFAVENHVNAVLAPTHHLEDPKCSDWLQIDIRACSALRDALDREGGKHIALDYPVIVSNVRLNEGAFRGEFLEMIADAPVRQIWVRASGLGTDAGPLTLKRYISSMAALHNLGKPVIADQLGGLPGLAAVAFGAISGFAHGIGERERFFSGDWFRAPLPRKDDDGFGRPARIIVPGLGKSFTRNELELLAAAKGAHRLVVCGDRHCCPHGLRDMLDDPRRHAAYQVFESINSMENVPPLSREHYFLNGPMVNATRLARDIKNLKISGSEAEKRRIDSGKLAQRLHDYSFKIEKIGTTLERLHETRGDETPRARPVAPGQPTNRRVEDVRP